MTRPLLVLTAFLSSAAVLVLEILAGRLLAPYIGMSVYTWTAIISTVLAGLTLGNWTGGYLSRGEVNADLRRLGMVLFAAALATISILLLIKPLAAAVLGNTDSAMTGVVLMSLGLFFLPAFFGGVASPIIAAAVVVMAPGREGRVLGAIYAAGSAGAIAGSAGSGFLLIPYLGSAHSTIAAAAVLGALSALWLGLTWQRVGGIAAAVVIAALAGAADKHWQTVCDAESPTFCIRVIGFDGPDVAGSRIRGMVLDHLVHGVNVEGQPEALLSPYTAQMDRAAQMLKPEGGSTFFVGGGAYTLPRAWADRGRIVVAEIDPTVTDVARDYFWVDTSRMEVLHQDARLALSRQPDAVFDIIVGDAFKDVAAPFHLVTREFAALVARKLQPDGLYLLNLVDREPDPKALQAVLATLQDVFPAVVAWRDDEPSAGPNRHTFVIAAANNSAVLFGNERASIEGWAPYAIDGQDPASDRILTDDHAPLEHLLGLVSDTVQ